MSSPTSAGTPDTGRGSALPGLARTLVYTVRAAFRTDARLALVTLTLAPAAWLDGTLAALFLKFLTDAALAHDGVAVVVAVSTLVVTLAGGWVTASFGRRLQHTLQEKAGVALEDELIQVSAGTPTLQHLERSDYLDRLDPLRKEAWIVHWTLESLAQTLGALAQTVLTIALLASVQPVLALLPVFGIPALLVGRAAALRERDAQEATGELRRRQHHLVTLATNASPGKEVRVFGIGDRLLRLSRETWRVEHARRTRVAWVGAGWQVVASAFFAVGFVGALVVVGNAVAAGLAGVGDLALALVLAATMSGNVGMVVSMFQWLAGCLAVGSRFLWLVDHARDEHRTVGASPATAARVPDRLRDAIELAEVTFTYPGTSRVVLDKVSLRLPAGRVVALVGANGAGKTTLVKLLCGMYAPTSGSIRVDGTDLTEFDLTQWRARCTGAFQDHARFEVTLREAVAIGDLDGGPGERAVADALEAAGAGTLVDVLPNGLSTQLGPTWPGGTDLSGGQWQKVALARGLMRPEPLLTVLDEPTASLDAPTEEALFAGYAAQSGTRGAHAVTLLVSHRFSTVRTADHIVVLAGTGVAEQGSHEELVARGGTYAQLYELQARGYR
ncbi:ABC transporter ATP-binding protein [Actinopolymorpha pittospori]|uniref:ATP-binding cassette subfamily B protein n=1 Tax=Actinopolymorpha pittospori TaxID=648752 RepID=A0A927R9Q1_9ACTN|nr:ABC transporter ATP-binding protein [Actinopolymorpha pittospori]MBE1606739.1 ATP-binding cassette subfamily B protein [Actinopolymorpha pittospori]